MVILKVTDITIPEGVTHIGTDWQVASDLKFTDVILESINDQVSLNAKAFNSNLDASDNYYGRCRFLLSTGYTVWSNIDVFIPEATIFTPRVNIFPSIVSIPILTTTSDASNHKHTLFTIHADGFAVSGDTIHLSTSWIIEDLDKNIVWDSLKDEVNLTSINITPDKLILDNKIYLIRAIFHTKSNDNSQIATRLISVNHNDRANIVFGLGKDIDSSIDNTLKAFDMEDLVSMKWLVESYDGSNITILEQDIVGNGMLELNIPADTLSANTYYMVTVEPFISTGTINKRYMLLKTI